MGKERRDTVRAKKGTTEGGEAIEVTLWNHRGTSKEAPAGPGFRFSGAHDRTPRLRAWRATLAYLITSRRRPLPAPTHNKASSHQDGEEKTLPNRFHFNPKWIS